MPERRTCLTDGEPCDWIRVLKDDDRKEYITYCTKCQHLAPKELTTSRKDDA